MNSLNCLIVISNALIWDLVFTMNWLKLMANLSKSRKFPCKRSTFDSNQVLKCSSGMFFFKNFIFLLDRFRSQTNKDMSFIIPSWQTNGIKASATNLLTVRIQNNFSSQIECVDPACINQNLDIQQFKDELYFHLKC